MVNVFSPALAPPTQISTRCVPGGQAEVSLARKLTTVAPGGTTGTVDAQNNWWGSFFGPSSSGQDALIANGNPVDSTPFSRFPIF